MPCFKVLHIIELNEDNKKDMQMYILWDIEEQKFFYYGTRNNECDLIQYNEYSGNYDNYQINNFVSFLDYIMDPKSDKTTELYDIFIDENEYNELSYFDIKQKCKNLNLLSAYDKVSKLVKNKLLKTIQMLVNN
uniref:Uncharacterized protein n=1 Tax=viral metagenome TaxID=1070528 RepID=A0A6C0I1Z6_9ZZZZ